MELKGYSIDRILKNLETAVGAQDKDYAMESVSELIIRVLESANVAVQKDLSKVSLTPPPGMFDIEPGMVLTFSGRLAPAGGDNADKKMSTNLKMRLFDPSKINSNGTTQETVEEDKDKNEPGSEIKKRKKDVPF